jgi:uncharacterized protein HemX
MEPETKSSGASVGLVVIVIILIIGSVYFWQSKVNTNLKQENTGEAVTQEDEVDLNSLSAELDSTDTSTSVDVDALR